MMTPVRPCPHLLSALLCLSACSALAPPPPAPAPEPPEGLIKARASFASGDWEALSSAAKSLPSSGPFSEEGLFYHAVTKGLEHPKYGLDSLLALESQGDEQLRERNQLYQLIFQGLRGECLLAIGPLKALYAPKLEGYQQGTRSLIQKVLKRCDEERADRSRQLGQELLEASKPKVETADSAEPTSPAPDPKAPPSPAQLEAVTPHVALILPKKREERSPNATRLLELAPIAREEIERTGKPLKIELYEPLGAEAIAAQLLNLGPETQLLVAFTLSRSHHDSLIEASRAQSRPLVLMSPHPLEAKAGDQIWRLFTSDELLSSAIMTDARRAGAQRVMAVITSGGASEALKLKLRTSALDQELQWEGVELAPPLKDTAQWERLAKRISARSVDTLIMALSGRQSAQLSTYLAAEGVWSAPSERFESPLKPLSEQGADQPKSARLYLWPSAYDDKTLKQAGRYLEGARILSPVDRSAEGFQALDQRLQDEISRPAHLLDPLFIELIKAVDLPLRLSLIQQRPSAELIQGLSVPEGSLPALSFKGPELMSSLKLIEVKEQRFQRRSQAPIDSASQLPTNPEGSKLEPIKAEPEPPQD